MTTDPFIEREEAERERATWQESAEAADRERHDWQVRAVKAEDRAGEYHDTITALRTDLATALDRAEKAEEERGWWEAEFRKERKEHAALSRAESHDRTPTPTNTEKEN